MYSPRRPSARSSQPGGQRSGILCLSLAALLLLALCLCGSSSGAVIQAGADLQAAVNGAAPGDTVVVPAGRYSSFSVDRPLTILAGGAYIEVGIQEPAVTILSSGVNITGLSILGTPRNPTAKFDYYMERFQPTGRTVESSALGPGALELNLPNAAILIKSNGVTLSGVTVKGAEVGVLARGCSEIDLQGCTFDTCGTGASLGQCSDCQVDGCTFLRSTKYGLWAEGARGINISGCQVQNTTHAGFMLKDSQDCLVEDSVLRENNMGIFLWRTNQSLIRTSTVSQNYYGMVISESHNNTVIDNLADDNSRSEIITGFGVGISLQENSSYNLVLKNRAEGSLNGIELTRNCAFNVVWGNNISRNTNGIRLDKNYNNLIYSNNLVGNTVSGYDNQTHNFWNASVGNYYSDYRGSDLDGDGIGDQPYVITKGSGEAADSRPLIRPYGGWEPDVAVLWADLARYASYDQRNDLPVRIENGGFVIRDSRPRSPPRFQDSPVVERPPYTPDI
ncbi:MAG: hypothetical protein GKC10_00955 [Methanosarcinales archaeon]|nr:hypothetical protein [Methanosarcinales archaeon]